jgi:hypothetical protein
LLGLVDASIRCAEPDGDTQSTIFDLPALSNQGFIFARAFQQNEASCQAEHQQNYTYLQ